MLGTSLLCCKMLVIFLSFYKKLNMSLVGGDILDELPCVLDLNIRMM